MATLKELHEQVGKFPFMAKRKSDQHPILFVAQVAGRIYPWIGVDDENGGGVNAWDDVGPLWELVPEPKPRRKALAWVHERGSIYWFIEGSDDAKQQFASYTRAPGFDILERDEGER